MNAPIAPSLFLAADEVATLTGYRVSARQIDWLRNKGWRFEVNSNRRPIIARRYAEKMLGCGTDDEQPKMLRPNFSALRVA